jgi:hypothetical protein
VVGKLNHILFFIKNNEIAATRNQLVNVVRQRLRVPRRLTRCYCNCLSEFFESQGLFGSGDPSEYLLRPLGCSFPFVIDLGQGSFVSLRETAREVLYCLTDVFIAFLRAYILNLERDPKKPASIRVIR